MTRAMFCVLRAAEGAERSSRSWPVAGRLQGIAVGPEGLRGSGGASKKGGKGQGRGAGEAGAGGDDIEAILERARSRGAAARARARAGQSHGGVGSMAPAGGSSALVRADSFGPGAGAGAVSGRPGGKDSGPLVSPHNSHVNSVVFPPAGRGRRMASADALGCVVLWTVGDPHRARGRGGTKDTGPRARRQAREEIRRSALDPVTYVPLSIVRPEGMKESPLVSIVPRPARPQLAMLGQPSYLGLAEVRGRTLQMLRQYPGLSCETSRINAVFSPDGRLLASGSE